MTTKKSMQQLGFKYKTDKAKKHRYTLAFPLYMECYRTSAIHFLEIGIKEGASLRMWDAYFEHKNAHLVAVDIDHTTLANVPQTSRWSRHWGDQSDTAFLTSLGDQHGPFDIIVDDGCHEGKYQLAAFKGLWPYVARGGIYVIEDISKNFLEKNILERHLIEMTKRLVVSGKRRGKTPYDFMHFYKNMVVIGKKTRT